MEVFLFEILALLSLIRVIINELRKQIKSFLIYISEIIKKITLKK
jgi:hypothetical protein